MTHQPDLFLADEPSDGFEDRPARAYSADPEKVRAELHRILGEARAAVVVPWQPPQAGVLPYSFPADDPLAAFGGSVTTLLRVRDGVAETGSCLSCT